MYDFLDRRLDLKVYDKLHKSLGVTGKFQLGEKIRIYFHTFHTFHTFLTPQLYPNYIPTPVLSMSKSKPQKKDHTDPYKPNNDT